MIVWMVEQCSAGEDCIKLIILCFIFQDVPRKMTCLDDVTDDCLGVKEGGFSVACCLERYLRQSYLLCRSFLRISVSQPNQYKMCFMR